MRTLIRFIVSILPITAAVLVILQIYITNELVGAGKELRQIERTIAATQEANERLTARVASNSSLLTLRQKAEALGFVEPGRDQILTFTETLPVAFQPQP